MSEQLGPSRPEGTPPPASQEGPAPPRTLPAIEQARLAAEILQPTLEELRKDIREVRGHSRTEFIVMISAFAAGFLVLAAMAIGAYRWGHEDLVSEATKADNRLDKLETRLEKIDERTIATGTAQAVIIQRLQDLLDRLPPAQTPLPRHQ